MINSKIGYEGKVTIKVKNKKPSTRHNEGTEYLFDLLHSILTQTLVLSDLNNLSKKLPAYFMIVHNENYVISNSTLLKGNYSDIPDKSKVLLQGLPIVNREITSDGIRFSALLAHNMLNTSVKYNTDRGYILMLDSNMSKMLAFSDIDMKLLQPVYQDVSGQASIDWQMSFDNLTKED